MSAAQNIVSLAGSMACSAMSGFRDTGALQNDLTHGTMPQESALSFEGAFAEHAFYSGVEHEKVLSISAEIAHTPDPLSHRLETYLCIALPSRFDRAGIQQLD